MRGWLRRATMTVGAVALAVTTLAGPARAAAQPSAECLLPRGGSSGAIDFTLYQRPIGTVRALMLFLDFPDAPATTDTSASQHLFDGASAWLGAASYGRVDLAITSVPRWIRMPQPSTSYHYERGFTADDHARYVADAVRAADPSVNFAGYDVYYFVANPDATAISFSPTFVFGDSFTIVADGATISRGVTFGADAPGWGYKVLDHETGHVFGLPDLYADVADNYHRYVGGWDLMGDISGQAPDYHAWFKWQLGWLDASQIACYDVATEADVELTPLETAGGLKAVVLRTGINSVTVAEYRTRQGNDAAACDTGVLVYTVNSAIASGSGPVRVNDAHPSAPIPDGCTYPLDDAARGPSDAAYTDATNGIAIQVLSTDDTARIRVTRTTTWTPPDVTHRRAITIRATGASTVTLTGRLTASPAYAGCTSGRPVKLQQWHFGTWVTIRTAATSSSGTWSWTWRAPKTRYRLVAGRTIAGSRPRHVCALAVSPILTIR